VAEARDQFGDLVTGRTGRGQFIAEHCTVSATVSCKRWRGDVIATATIAACRVAIADVIPSTVASVTVAARSHPQVGESVQLVATARDANGYVIAGTTASWSTSNAGIATVSATGVLQGGDRGVVITATINGVSGSVSLTITPHAPASVTITARR